MQIAGERHVARRLAPGAAALVLAVLVAGCSRGGTPEASAQEGPRPTPAPGWSLESVPRDSLLAYGGRLRFDASHPASDAQNLIVPAGARGRASVGPYASIAPEIGALRLSRTQLGSGRIIALIESDGAYAPLRLDRGRTYIWVDSMGTGSEWRIVLISSTFATPLAWKRLISHYRETPNIRAMMSTCRWTQPATSADQPCCACEDWGWCTGDSTMTWSAIAK